MKSPPLPALCSIALALAMGACGKNGGSGATARPSAPRPPIVLTLAGQTELPGYAGDFDHFAIDVKGDRLFLAGEEHAELDVFDLRTGALIDRRKGFGVPHSPFLLPEARELLVVDGAAPSRVLDLGSLRTKRSFKLAKGADSIGYDGASKHLWVVTGGKDVPLPFSHLTEIDPATGAVFKNIKFDADHVEAMAIEQAGDRLFINVTDHNLLAVIDKKAGAIVQTWPIKEAQQNAPLALDEKTHRLFVVTRKPGKLLVLNAETGASIASFKAPERTDQVIWDEANRRIYVTGGEGYIGVVQQDDADHYSELAPITSAPGAKTAILEPSLNRLYVAVSPGETKTMAELIWFDVAPRP